MDDEEEEFRLVLLLGLDLNSRRNILVGGAVEWEEVSTRWDRIIEKLEFRFTFSNKIIHKIK